MKGLLLLLLVCLTMQVAVAQSDLHGKVMEYKTRIGLAGVRIENLTLKKSAVTDNQGNFTIAARTNDILVLKVFAYQPDTVLVTDIGNKEIFLQPIVNRLKEVNITQTTTKNLNIYYDPRFHGQPVIYAHDDKFNYKGGIVWRLAWWKKDQKKKDKLRQLEQRYASMDKIYAVFQPDVLTQYIPLSGQDLQNFINLYTPSPEQVSSRKFELTVYLNDCLKKYWALPPDQRQPALISK